MTIALVLANVVCYLLEIRHGGSFFGGPTAATAVRWGAIPYELTHPGEHCELATRAGAAAVLCRGRAGALGAPASQPATWLTVPASMFLHGSFLPVFASMLFLVIFGPSVEDAMSRPRYLAFYLLGGAVALAAQVAVSPGSSVPALGAAGAVAGVLGAYVVLHRRARVITLVCIPFFFTIVELPALALLGLWFPAQLWFDLSGLADPLAGSEGVAYLAQLGGLLFGLLAVRAFVARRGGAPPAGGLPATAPTAAAPR